MKILLGASMYCTTGWGEKQHIVFLYIAGPPYVPLFTKRYMYKVPAIVYLHASCRQNIMHEKSGGSMVIGVDIKIKVKKSCH